MHFFIISHITHQKLHTNTLNNNKIFTNLAT